jgi:hypothetical protein
LLLALLECLERAGAWTLRSLDIKELGGVKALKGIKQKIASKLRLEECKRELNADSTKCRRQMVGEQGILPRPFKDLG